ncbi:DNA recombination protein RmuC [Limibacillus halophilus]|uniref:DNA recombination protein RmuC homolog n=1 Tax=Limibacillus halophilus TaxID=1579333 RepID=A0A839SYD7_9PROT|nr:DNA recombination protein RmuC [Limibacillus halophilus]MBB3066634.1 DNA recombination protein RmuC [Limibacillus halophilus]
MDIMTLGVILLAVVAGLLGGWLLNARRSDVPESAELSGRLAQMAEGLAVSQNQIAERLQGQERVLSQMVEQRLTDFGKRVSDRLQEQSTTQQKTLGELRERLVVIDKAQQNITELSKDVVSLQDILSNKQARGAFGEVQLKDLVSAILPPSSYGFQTPLSTGVRVDCLLQLPNPPGPIGIDAKFPLESYEALRSAGDEAAKLQASRRFRDDVRRHITAIAEKYIIPGETAESALMFLPSEAVYAELHANFRGVVEESYSRRVWIVSPTTLMATLNTVRAVLKDVRMREQAHVIQREVMTLSKDIERLDERVAKLRKHFDSANSDIRDIEVSSGKISSRSSKIGELQLEDPDKDGKPTLAPPLAGGGKAGET